MTEAMKTIEMKTMKTGTNLRKTAIRSVALVFSLVLIASVVEAKELQKRSAAKNRMNETALLAMSEKENFSVNTYTENSFRHYTREAFDPAPELESWMLNSNFFEPAALAAKKTSVIPAENRLTETVQFYGRQAAEEPLKLETWMSSQEFWNF